MPRKNNGDMDMSDLFDNHVITVACNHSEKFTKEFLDWLPLNLHVWNAFEWEAIQVYNRGFKHYSSKTIIHFLRHHSALNEIGGEWKINNNFSPYLARLFDMMHPGKQGLWEYRETKKVTMENGGSNVYQERTC